MDGRVQVEIGMSSAVYHTLCNSVCKSVCSSVGIALWRLFFVLFRLVNWGWNKKQNKESFEKYCIYCYSRRSFGFLKVFFMCEHKFRGGEL